MTTDLSQVIETMSTPEIAELTGKRHDNVMRVAKMLVERGIICSPQIEERYNNNNIRKIYRLTKTESINLVANLSPEFTAAIIDRWQELEEQARQPVELPYHIRRYLANANNVPKGYFAVLPEMCNRLIFPLDKAGYHLPENMLPDISFGKMFCKHFYEDGRVVKPKCYPYEIYHEVWIPKQASKYFQTRDENALPYLSKAFGLLAYN